MIETLETILKNLGIGYKLIFIIITIISGLILSKLVHFFMNRILKKASDTLKVDPTNYSFLKNAVSFVIFTIMVIIIFYSIPELKSVGVSLMASAGILAAILGFASQQAFSNIISGIFIVIFKPFRVGDFIKIGELHHGTVEDITLRHTVINNPENRRIIIPNAVISSETILNSSISDPKVCSFLEIGISYNSNVDKAIEIIQKEATKHPNILDNRTAEDLEQKKDLVVVRLINLADSCVTLRAYIWAQDSGKAFVMKCDLFKSIKKEFEANGIEIPFPHQTVYLRQEKPLQITQS